MKILYLTGREIQYSRNEVILAAFRRFADVKPIDIGTSRSILFRTIGLSFRVIPLLVFGHYDLVFVGFYGHLLMLVVGIFSRAPILFDAFISTYDTLVSDRQRFSPASIGAKLAFWLDRTACQMADWILVDTPLQASFFREQFLSSTKPITAIPVGCQQNLFYPQESKDKPRFEVLYYCSFLPLHGADIVVQAAGYLKDLPLNIRIIGSGPDYTHVRQIAKDLDLKNITWVDPIPLRELPAEIASADICLGGHFGPSEKAGRVIPGKVYQILAEGRPLIAGDTPANRMLLEHQINAILCPIRDPISLASAIQELYHDPILRQKIGCGARKLYEESCSEAVITAILQDVCGQITQRKSGAGG
jgi:glycosyltransferase involved in cell wall biosynthesis